MENKKESKKFPFAVIKKGAIGLAMAGMMAFTPFMAGCSEPGAKGEKGDIGDTGATGAPGATWHHGVDTPTTATGVQGDYYFETDSRDVWYYGPTGWSVVSNLGGSEGEEGISQYMGYDGYVWEGTKRTSFKADNVTLDDYVVENTIGVEGMMSKYFAGSYIDLESNTVALMNRYVSHAKMTLYSDTLVSSIKVVAENAGDLYVGTAKVADIVEARATGGEYDVTSERYDVVAGLNTISLDLEVAEDETIVLGGNGSVGLYMVKGIAVDDEDGNYTLVDGASHTDLLSSTDSVTDTLAVQVKAKINEYYNLLPGIKEYADAKGLSNLAIFSKESEPYAYVNANYFGGKTLSKIGVPVHTLDNYAVDGTFTIWVIKKNTNKQFSSNYVSKHVLTLPANTFSTNTPNAWYYFDVEDMGITLGTDESLAFFDQTDTVWPGYSKTAVINGPYNFSTSIGNGTGTNYEIFFDIIAVDKGPIDIEEKEEYLEEQDAEAIRQEKIAALKTLLDNKQFSILGDSISTFLGVSNDAVNTNSTIGNNAYWYDTELAVTDTWWKQISDMTGMDILVNNSYSGDTVANAKTSRCINLHDNTDNTEDGQEDPHVLPNIIASYIGVNDIKNDANLSKETFKANYLTMVQNMKTAYPNAKIFLFTIPQYTYSNSRTDAELEVYNDAIREIAQTEGCYVVDLFKDSGITKANHSSYTIDNLHPNAIGMDLITQCFWDVLYDVFVTKASN